MNTQAHQRQEFSVFSRFAKERLVFHANLSCPVKVVYKEFQRWAGVDALPADVFVHYLKEMGVGIEAKGKGRLKCVANGIGVRPLVVKCRGSE